MRYFVVALLFFLVNCKKKESGAPSPVSEENIVFDLNTGASVIQASNNFDFQVTLKSKMPAKGIRIEISATEEASSLAVTPQAVPFVSTTTITKLSVQNLPRQKWVITNVKVTSESLSSNSSTQSFKIIFK